MIIIIMIITEIVNLWAWHISSSWLYIIDNNNNNNNIYLKSSIQTSSIDYKNYYGMYKYNKYDYTNRSVIIING